MMDRTTFNNECTKILEDESADDQAERLALLIINSPPCEEKEKTMINVTARTETKKAEGKNDESE